MRRLPQILSSIFVGALAVGLGMGVYLHKANQDRERLAVTAATAEQIARRAQDQQTLAVEEANKKLAAANTEILKARDTLRTIKTERDAMATAEILTGPKAKDTREWKETVDQNLGISIKFPPTATTTRTTESLRIFREAGWNSFGITIWPISEWPDTSTRNLSDILKTWTEKSGSFEGSTSTVSFRVNNHLLIGIRGKGPSEQDNELTYRLVAVKDGVLSHTFFFSMVDTAEQDQLVRLILSTLSFKD